MNEQIDSVVWRAFGTSAIARAIEQGARRLRAAVSDSRSVAGAQPWIEAAAAHRGVALIAAALTHLVLTAAITRPAYWQWTILPSIALAAGIVLAASKRRH